MAVNNITPELKKEFDIRESKGVVVVSVDPGSPADDAGIQPGDVIREVNRMPVKDNRDYERAMTKTAKGNQSLLLIKRGGQNFYVSLSVS